jgi:hypothetical protein
MQGLTKSQKKRLAKKKAKAKAEATSDGAEVVVDAENNNSGETNGAMLDTANAQDAETADVTKMKKKKKKSGAAKGQTEPPTVPISDLFPNGRYPEGEWQSYSDECAAFCNLEPMSESSCRAAWTEFAFLGATVDRWIDR